MKPKGTCKLANGSITLRPKAKLYLLKYGLNKLNGKMKKMNLKFTAILLGKELK